MANELLNKASLHLGASPQNERGSLLYKIPTVGNSNTVRGRVWGIVAGYGGASTFAAMPRHWLLDILLRAVKLRYGAVGPGYMLKGYQLALE
jgi:hypothetical protein